LTVVRRDAASQVASQFGQTSVNIDAERNLALGPESANGTSGR